MLLMSFLQIVRRIIDFGSSIDGFTMKQLYGSAGPSRWGFCLRYFCVFFLIHEFGSQEKKNLLQISTLIFPDLSKLMIIVHLKLFLMLVGIKGPQALLWSMSRSFSSFFYIKCSSPRLWFFFTFFFSNSWSNSITFFIKLVECFFK